MRTSYWVWKVLPRFRCTPVSSFSTQMRTLHVVGYATAFSIVFNSTCRGRESRTLALRSSSPGYLPLGQSFPRTLSPGTNSPMTSPCATVTVTTVCCWVYVYFYFLTQQPRETCKMYCPSFHVFEHFGLKIFWLLWYCFAFMWRLFHSLSPITTPWAIKRVTFSLWLAILQKKLVSSCLVADIWGSARTAWNMCSRGRFSGSIYPEGDCPDTSGHTRSVWYNAQRIAWSARRSFDDCYWNQGLLHQVT